MKVQNDLSQKYSKGTIWVHWLTAILILILFPLGKYVEELEPVDKLGFLKLHAILGFVVLFLTIYRSYLFFKVPRPSRLKTGSKFNDKLLIWIDNSFYYILILLAFSGIATMITTGYGDAISSGDVNLIKPHEDSLPLKGHGILATLMMLLFVLHVVGVIKHKILTKENALKRIF